MTNILLMYNVGNSGGSWMEAVLNSHPDVQVWEEPRRHLKLPKPGEGLTNEQIQVVLVKQLVEWMGEKKWGCVGFIKGFRPVVEKAAFCLSDNVIFAQQFRHPIKVIHGTRKRSKQPRNYWGREPVGEKEYFIGHVGWQARRYRKYLARCNSIATLRLEKLSRSLASNCVYITRALEYMTGLMWTGKQIENIYYNVWPRHRQDAPGPVAVWLNPKDEYLRRKRLVPWDKRPDPSVTEIWEHWKQWQRKIFVEEFQAICLSCGYTIPF